MCLGSSKFFEKKIEENLKHFIINQAEYEDNKLALFLLLKIILDCTLFFHPSSPPC